MLNADRMKVLLIDYLLDRFELDILVSEFSFLQGYRKADIVTFGTDQISAFEIKSPRDKLTRLSNQMADYSSVFTYCYLVTTDCCIEKARQLVRPRVGLILISNDNVQVIRQPKENRRLSKQSLYHSIPSNVFPHSNKKKACRAKSCIDSITTSSLQKAFYTSMISKYERQYRAFMLDRGNKTSLTDLYYLQSN